MLDFEKIRRWYDHVPAPVVWLLAIAFLFVWLLIIYSFFLVVDGGYQKLVSALPPYAKDTALKLLSFFSALLVVYLAVRGVGFLIKRKDRSRQTTTRHQGDLD